MKKKNMTEDFKILREQVHIQDVATRLLGEPIRGMYRFPGERTASLKIYPETQSFYDFGRNTGGDVIALWAHVRNCNNWETMNEIAALYGISTDLNTEDRRNITERIKAQETAQREREQGEKRRQKRWVKEVECLQEWRKLCQNLLDSGHLPPFCDVRSWCYSEIQTADYRLDILCEIK